ncbi:MAG: DUF4399 domain-containing protein [Flavobacteriales bacterium]|nr:DUF4399 domain-containing protein [Flavobacteriales bacterium]
MRKLSILAIAIGFVLASCGEAPKTTEVKEMKHDEMHDEGAGHEDDGHDHDHDAMEEAAEAVVIPEGAKVFFANLKDGQTVTSPLKVEFGVEGMEVEPAGELTEGKGHHHIIINGSSLEGGVIVPANETNIHFGKGQLETELELVAGEHTLTMQFADGYHQSYGEQMSATIL